MSINLAAVLALAALALAVASFLLGYYAAATQERRAKKILDANLKLAIRQKRDISEWIRSNWPDETTAYRLGHSEGYQQGVLQGPFIGSDE